MSNVADDVDGPASPLIREEDRDRELSGEDEYRTHHAPIEERVAPACPPRRAVGSASGSPKRRGAGSYVVVMRHGERHDAVAGIDEGDTVLTKNGIDAVAATASRLIAALVAAGLPEEAIDSARVVTSPFRRCIQTALALQQNMPRSGGGWDDCDAGANDAATLPPLELDPSLGEVFGPQRIKVGEAPAVDGWLTDAPTAVMCAIAGGGAPSKAAGALFPAAWGEDVPAAHRRL